MEAVERITTHYIVFPGPSEQELRERVDWETAPRLQQLNPAHWTSIEGEVYDSHTQEQPQLFVRRLDQVDSVASSSGGEFLVERAGDMQESYPDRDETTYEANETTTLGQSNLGIRLHFLNSRRLTLATTADTTVEDPSTSVIVWSATQPPPSNIVQNPSLNFSQFPSTQLTQTVDAPQLLLDPTLVTPLDKARERMDESFHEKAQINVLAAIIVLEHLPNVKAMARTRWTLGDFTGATLVVTLFGSARGWNEFVKVGDVVHLTSQSSHLAFARSFY